MSKRVPKPDQSTDLPDIEDTGSEEEHDNPEVEENDDDLDDDLDESDEGDEDEDEDDDEDADEEHLGDKGKKALDRMKRDRRDLKRTIRELRKEIEDLRNAGDEEDDELTSAKKAATSEREKRLDAERRLAAKEAGLPASWAKRLEGEDYEDFLEDAEALAEDLPQPTHSRKGGGGAKDGKRKRKAPSLDEQIAQAERDGDHPLVRRLKAQKIHEIRAAAS